MRRIFLFIVVVVAVMLLSLWMSLGGALYLY